MILYLKEGRKEAVGASVTGLGLNPRSFVSDLKYSTGSLFLYGNNDVEKLINGGVLARSHMKLSVPTLSGIQHVHLNGLEQNEYIVASRICNDFFNAVPV